MKTVALAATLAATLGMNARAQMRAPELPDLKELKSRLKDIEVPAAKAEKAAAEAAKASCPVPDLSGATVGRGIFSMSYTVKQGDRELGSIREESGAYVLRDASGAVMARQVVTRRDWGTKSDILDCSGARIGGIQEEADDTASNFTISDASGEPIAHSGWQAKSSFDLTDVAGAVVASVKNDHWFADRMKLGVGPRADGRVIAITAVMNNAAAYRRSAEERRRDPPERPDHDPRDR